MDLYEEIMKYKINNYLMLGLLEKTQESTAEQTEAILYSPNIESRNNKIKNLSFECLLNTYLIVDQDLLLSSELDRSDFKMENVFGVMEIEILKVFKLKLKEKRKEMIENTGIKFRFFKNKNNFVLELIYGKHNKKIYLNKNKQIYESDIYSFSAYLDETKNELTIEYKKLDDFLTVSKNEIRFEIENNDEIVIMMDASHKISARGTNQNFIFVKDGDSSYLCKHKTTDESSQNTCYLLKYIFKKREIDGYFKIQNHKFFEYLKEKSLEYQKKIKNEEKKIDLQVIMNFDIDEKKETIKNLILEAKSSTNNYGKTIKQFTHHLTHLAIDAKENDETLFLLYIQNDPEKITVQEYECLLENKNNVAIILIDPVRFSNLPYIKKGKVFKDHSYITKYINNALISHSDSLSINSTSQQIDFKKFLPGVSNVTDPGLNKEYLGTLSYLQENDVSVGNAETPGNKICESNLKSQISVNNFSKNQQQMISSDNNKDLKRSDEYPLIKFSYPDNYFSHPKIDNCLKENNSLKDNMKFCQLENENLNEKLKNSLSQIDFLNNNYNILNSEKEDLWKKLNDYSEKCEKLMKDNNESNNKNGELHWKLQSSNSEIEKLNQKLKNYENRAGIDKWVYIFLALLIGCLCTDKYYKTISNLRI